MAVIPQPDGLSFPMWAAQVYDAFPLTTPQPVPEDMWRFWATATVAAFQVTGYTLPMPEGFDTWQAWVRAFLFVYPQLSWLVDPLAGTGLNEVPAGVVAPRGAGAASPHSAMGSLTQAPAAAHRSSRSASGRWRRPGPGR